MTTPTTREAVEGKGFGDVAKYEATMSSLRASGASCGTCRHFTMVPSSKRFGCAEESDHGHYLFVTADGLCPNWKARP